MAAQLGALIKNVLLALVNLFIMLFVIFFFFRDGKKYTDEIMELLPFPRKQKEAILQKIHNTFSAVLNGLFLVSVIQGIMTGLGFFVFGLPFGVFWGFLASITSLVPIGGAALVWIPGALYLIFTGSTLKGVLLAAWGILLVSSLDNFLKPLLIGKKAKLPMFSLFLGILGGMQVFGFLGILFGPIVVTLLMAFLDIYREEYARE
jgi:predicted PurR-regulated permease PerM